MKDDGEAQVLPSLVTSIAQMGHEHRQTAM